MVAAVMTINIIIIEKKQIPQVLFLSGLQNSMVTYETNLKKK